MLRLLGGFVSSENRCSEATHEVIIDVFYIHDVARSLYGFLSIVDNGTTYHSISLVCEGQWDSQVF